MLYGLYLLNDSNDLQAVLLVRCGDLVIGLGALEYYYNGYGQPGGDYFAQGFAAKTRLCRSGSPGAKYLALAATISVLRHRYR